MPKGIPKSWKTMLKVSTGAILKSSSILNGFSIHFGRAGPSKTCFPCTRNTHFHKFTFSGKWSQKGRQNLLKCYQSPSQSHQNRGPKNHGKTMPSKIDFGPEKSAEGTPKSDPGASKIHFQDALGAPVREHAPIYVQTALSDPPFGSLGPHFGSHFYCFRCLVF